MKEIYNKLFDTDILPFLENIEKRRIKTLTTTCTYAIINIIMGISFAFLFLKYNSLNPFILTFFLIGMNFFVINAITTIVAKNRYFQTYLYNEILPLYLKPIANFVSWPKNQNTENLIKAGIFGNFDMQDDETCYFGHYNKTNILISKTRLTLPSNGLDNRNLFKGTIIQLELEQKNIDEIIICSKNEIIPSKLKQTKTKLFNTYCNNTQLINPNIYSILKKITLAYLADSIIFSLKNNTIIIALKEKQKCRLGNLFKTVNDKKNYDKLTRKLIAIFNLVDELNS